MKTHKVDSKKNLYLAGDYHFFHNNIIKFCNRPFLKDEKLDALSRPSNEAVERMNNHLIDETNEVVQVDDTLVFLGDWCFPSRYDLALKLRNRFVCQNIICIWGNHDREEIGKAFNSSHDMLMVNYRGQNIFCCHYYPLVFPKNHHGAWAAVGHCHSNMETWIEQNMPSAKMLDCGIDNHYRIFGNYRPFSFDEFKSIMDKRSGLLLDHHQ